MIITYPTSRDSFARFLAATRLRRYQSAPVAHGWLNHQRVAVLWCLTSVALSSVGCVGPWERSALLSRKDATIDGVQGPTERGLRSRLLGRDNENVDNSPLLKPLEGAEEYAAAAELYKQGEHKEAQTQLKSVLHQYRKSDIREEAMFTLAESYYAEGKYAKAYDTYGELLTAYPSTRHLPDTSNRLFKIAQLWLDQPQVAELGEIQQVDYNEPSRKLPAEQPVEDTSRPIWLINLTDQQRPIFDTTGNGLAALKLIWLNDPTGPLADDALMLAASHYARKGDFVEADHHFTMLREQFPTSPHVQNAFVLGAHVKLMSYEGAAYDNKSLEDAAQLKETIRRLYPDSSDGQRVEQELQKIAEERAARDWALVELYERKQNYRAAAVYCHLVIDRHSQTSFAARARDKLLGYGPEYASGAVLNKSTPDVQPTLYDAILNRDPSQPPPRALSAANPAPRRFGRRPTPAQTPELGANPPRTAASNNDTSTGETEYDAEAPTTPEEASSKRSWNPLRWSRPERLPEAADDDAQPAQTAPDATDPLADPTSESGRVGLEP